MQQREREDWLSRIDAALAFLKREPTEKDGTREHTSELSQDASESSRER